VSTSFWTDDKNNRLVKLCPVRQEVLGQADTEGPVQSLHHFRPGRGEVDHVISNSIDTCVPKAPNLGVPEANVFK
jgi:hypothetical protein